MQEPNQKTRFYRHYKNKPYKYIGIVRHSETLEELALYESLYENKLGRMWVRPKDMFFENVTIEGVNRPRFEKVNFRFHESSLLTEREIREISEIYEICFAKKLNLAKFHSIIDQHAKKFFVMVYDQDKMVGFKLGFGRDSELFYSWSGAVLPDYESLGLASTMMDLQHHWAKKNEFKRIQTRTRSRFSRMLSLNLKYGFEVCGTLSENNSGLKIILEKIIND